MAGEEGNSDSRKIVAPTLDFLQDLYLNRFCHLQAKIKAGERLKVIDDQIYSVYISDQITQAAKQMGGNIAVHLKNIHIATLYKLEEVANYFQGEYKPTSSDEEFLNEFLSVWPEIFRTWYYKTVYIGYGEDLINLEKESLKKNKLPYYEHKCKFYSKFRVYTRVDQNNEIDSVGEYTSVLSGVTNIKIDSEKLVCASCNSGINWIKWWHHAGEYNTGIQKYLSAFESSIKKLNVIVTNKAAFDWEISQLKNNNIYMIKFRDQAMGMNNNKDKPIEIFPVPEVLQVLTTHMAYFETETAWLGFSGKGMNQKQSGVTDAENYQNMKLISNIQEANISQLNVLAWRMKKTFEGSVPEDFHFEISGQAPADGLPGSMNANMEGGGTDIIQNTFKQDA